MNPYRKFVLENVPRLLSQLDRDRNSKTYGCFDRNYWHYKIRDFSSSILQQGALTLALLYKNRFKGNIYYKNKKIKEWTKASLNFWRKMQLKDGSFNEYYPNEHGYPPTAFSLCSIAECYRLLDMNDYSLKEAMLKASRFILKRTEKEALNQEITSIKALYNVYLVTKEEWILKSMKIKLKNILSKQSKEGWFSEYGGVDVGYLTVSLNYLAEYYKDSGDRSVSKAIKKMIDFLQFFIHPDGTCGGEYGSRNTEYFLPNGLEIMAEKYPLAGAMADKIFRDIKTLKIYQSIDDRYLLHYFLHSFVKAMLNYKTRKTKLNLPCKIKTDKIFKEAGLYVINNGKYYAVSSLAKGGVLKIFVKNKEMINDCGYLIESDKDTYVSNWLGDYKKIYEKSKIIVSGNLYKINQIIPTPIKSYLLRLASSVLGEKLIPILKKQMITKHNKSNINFKREIDFLKNKIIIKDDVASKSNMKKVLTTDRFSFKYVPSSKYFQISNIINKDEEFEFENINHLKIIKEIDILKQKIIIKKQS